VWFSGCNKHSTARTPQVIQLPAARFRNNDSTDNEVSGSLWDYRNCRQTPNKPSASIAAADKAVCTFALHLFFVLLTVYLSIILAIDQLNAQILVL